MLIVIGYLLVGLVITVAAMVYDKTLYRDYFGDADPVRMLLSTLLWPVTTLLALFAGIALIFKL